MSHNESQASSRQSARTRCPAPTEHMGRVRTGARTGTSRHGVNRCSLLHRLTGQFAGLFTLVQLVVARSPGLLIPRSRVRVQPGPSNPRRPENHDQRAREEARTARVRGIPKSLARRAVPRREIMRHQRRWCSSAQPGQRRVTTDAIQRRRSIRDSPSARADSALLRTEWPCVDRCALMTASPNRDRDASTVRRERDVGSCHIRFCPVAGPADHDQRLDTAPRLYMNEPRRGLSEVRVEVGEISYRHREPVWSDYDHRGAFDAAL